MKILLVSASGFKHMTRGGFMLAGLVTEQAH